MTAVFQAPPPPRPAVRAGMRTAVALGASTAVLLFSVLTLASTWWTKPSAHARRSASAPTLSSEVDLWVGELSPGVRAALSSPRNDPDGDRAQDDAWNRGLHRSASPLA